MIRPPENFREQVKKIRRQLGFSPQELAHALGVSFAMVNRWENGKTLPSKLVLLRYEQYCGNKKVRGRLHDE